jgi:hypothetical protein
MAHDQFLKVRASAGSVPMSPTAANNPYFQQGIGTGSNARPAHEIVRGMSGSDYDSRRSRLYVCRDGKKHYIQGSEILEDNEREHYEEPLPRSGRGLHDGVVI